MIKKRKKYKKEKFDQEFEISMKVIIFRFFISFLSLPHNQLKLCSSETITLSKTCCGFNPGRDHDFFLLFPIFFSIFQFHRKVEK